MEIIRVKSPHFDEIFEMQKKLQERIGVKPENLSIDDIAKFWFANKHALDDELSEMFDALGGEDDGVGNAGWKWWKAANTDMKNKTIKDLSDSDYLKLKFEIVDAFHFMINFAVTVGMTGAEMFSLYKAKNAENFKRQDDGY